MPSPPQPVLHPGTGDPVGPDDLTPLFPMELILQEVSEEPEIPVPEKVLDIYSLWRPTPLYPGAPTRAGRGHAVADLLHVRGRRYAEGGKPIERPSLLLYRIVNGSSTAPSRSSAISMTGSTSSRARSSGMLMIGSCRRSSG
jgi:hypothetical protein